MPRLSSWLGKASAPRPDLTRGTLPIATPQVFQSDLLRDALSTRAPGQWYTNKIALAQAMRGVVYLAVNTLATQFSAAKPVLYEQNDDEMDEDGLTRLSRLDPMYNLIRHPNPLDTWSDVAYQMSMQLDITGMSLVWMPPDDGDEGGEPAEMYVIPTGTAFPLPRSPQYPQGAYRVVPYYNSAFFAVAPNYNAGAGAVIPGEQVVAIRNHHPLLRWEGYAVLTAISLSVDTINGIDLSRFNGMQQGCEQTIALELDAATQNPNTDDLRRIREEWQKVYAGARNTGKIVLTPPGAKINKFSTEPDKMAWQEGWSQVADFILAAYQTPKAITGMTVGDRTFLVGKPSKADLVTIRTWVRTNAPRILGATAGLGFTSDDLKGLSPEDRRLFLGEAAKAAKRGKKDLSEDQVMDLMTSPEGAAYMVWVAARKHDPSVTFEWLKAQVNEDNVADVLAAFDDATGVRDEEGDPDPKVPGSASSGPT